MKVDRLDNVKRSTERSPYSSYRIEKEVRHIVTIEFARTKGRPVALYDAVIALAEKPLIEAVLDHERRNQMHAALALGINRNTLRKKMRAHGIKA